MSLQYYDSDNEALIPIAGNVNPSDVIELKATKADKTQISNPNLLDNPWFTVNQRGFTSESGINKYTVDRWYTILSANLTANANGSLTIEGTGDYGSCLCQKIENTLGERLKGKTVTFSVLLSDGTIYSATDTLPTTYPSSADTAYCNLSSLIPNGFASAVYWSVGQNCLVAQVGQTTGNSCTVVAIKLELGSISTLAMDTAPNYASELLKCQRYYLPIRQASRFVGTYISTTSVAFFVPTPVQMRVAPSVTGITKLGMGISSGAINTTSITSQTGQYNASNGVGVLVEFTSNTSPTQYSVASVCALDNDFALSADL